MVTVLRVGGFAVRIFKNDHEPVHVHVYGDGEARIDVARLTVLSVRRMSRRDVSRALTIVRENQAVLLQRWREIHG